MIKIKPAPINHYKVIYGKKWDNCPIVRVAGVLKLTFIKSIYVLIFNHLKRAYHDIFFKATIGLELINPKAKPSLAVSLAEL